MAKRRKKRKRLKQSERRILFVAVVCAVLMVLALAAWWWAASPPDVVARVLFSETANCTRAERNLVAGVIQNRIRAPAFGNADSLRGVVLYPGAFSCVNDANNSNWLKTRNPARMTAAERAVWQQCLELANGDIPDAAGPSGRPLVYYHDKSIGKPRSWDNDKWRAIEEVRTPHFVFYSIVPARG